MVMEVTSCCRTGQSLLRMRICNCIKFWVQLAFSKFVFHMQRYTKRLIIEFQISSAWRRITLNCPVLACASAALYHCQQHVIVPLAVHVHVQALVMLTVWQFQQLTSSLVHDHWTTYICRICWQSGGSVGCSLLCSQNRLQANWCMSSVSYAVPQVCMARMFICNPLTLPCFRPADRAQSAWARYMHKWKAHFHQRN